MTACLQLTFEKKMLNPLFLCKLYRQAVAATGLFKLDAKKKHLAFSS
jgi:hypothetical protein